MQEFRYEALDEQGKPIKGTALGESAEQVIDELREHGMHPTSVIEVKGKEGGEGLRGMIAIIAGAFAFGLVLPFLSGRLRNELLDEGAGMTVGVMLGCGVTAALVAAMLTLVDRIQSPGKRQLALFAGIFTIVAIILFGLTVIADLLNW